VKGRLEAVAEATLRGHLKAQGTEETGSQSYVPPDPKNDKALNLADDLLRGTALDTAFPPSPHQSMPN
jgi:carboxyl-terminal processing protease